MNKKKLTKDISCECKYKFYGRKCNSNQQWNNDKCWCKCKQHRIYEKDYIWNPATFSYKCGKYFALFTAQWSCVTKLLKNKQQQLQQMKKKATCKTKNI